MKTRLVAGLILALALGTGCFPPSNHSAESVPIMRPMWTFSPGPGWMSDPVAEGGNLYVLHHKLYGLISLSGKELWEREVELRAANYHRPLVAAGGRVYFMADDKHVHALDGRTGRELWHVGPIFSLLAATGDAVFILDENQQLTLLDNVTGHVRHQTQIHGEKESRLYVSGDRLLLIVWPDLRVYDAHTFLPLWTFHENAKDLGLGAYPAGSFVYVDADRAIHALSGSSGKELWIHSTYAIVQAVDGGRLYYTAQGGIRALDRRTGAPLGTLRIAGANSLFPYGALAAGGGQLYIPVDKSHDFFSGFSNSKDSALCAVDAATGHKVWCSAWQYEYLNVAVYKEGLVFISSTGEGNRSSALYGFRGAPPNSYTP
jgi:outer membrane protein assembly factor BamB